MKDLMRWDVVNELLEFTAERRYLEIGVQGGVMAHRVRDARERWGVDPAPMPRAPARYSKFFRGTSDAFFAQLDPAQRFDVVFVDGLHTAKQSLRDVDNALRHLAPGGTVVMHDCNPLTEPAQRVPRETGIWNGDVWKAMVALRQRDDVQAFTINADHGLGIVRPCRNLEPLTGASGPLTYEALTADRERLLGLVPAKAWAERVAPLSVGRLVVLSAIFGGRDTAIPVPRDLDADECILFTDGPGAAGWTVRRETPDGDPRRAARRIKTLALEMVEADVVLWVDGRIRLTGEPLRPLLRRALRGHDIAGFPHPWRHTVAAEAKECGDLGMADPEALAQQVEAYREAGFPDAGGLLNTMVLARRNTEAARALGRDWWEQIQAHTVRDQVSLPFLLWWHDMRAGKLGADVYAAGSSQHFERGQHCRSAVAA